MKDFFLTGLILKIRAARQETCRQAVRTSLSAHSSSIWEKSSLPIFSRCPGTPSGGAPILAATQERQGRARFRAQVNRRVCASKLAVGGRSPSPSILAAKAARRAPIAHSKIDEFASANSQGCGFAASPSILAATFFVTLSLLLASCSRASVQPQAPVQSPSSESEPASESLTADFPADIPVDYDLTKMNANMVYAQVFNLMLEPQKFENSTFKIQGSFIKANGPKGQPVYAVIIKDALACCQQGLEFIWDFAGAEPQIEQEILVIGKYTLTTTPDGLDHNYLAARICQVLPH